jgi:hypothetical protein
MTDQTTMPVVVIVVVAAESSEALRQQKSREYECREAHAQQRVPSSRHPSTIIGWFTMLWRQFWIPQAFVLEFSFEIVKFFKATRRVA